LNSPLETSPHATTGDDAPAAGAPVAGTPAAGAPAPRPAASALAASLNPRRVAELDDIFADNGLLARQIDGYRSRASQIEMSRAVAAAMEASGRAMPEPAMFEAQKRPARRLQTAGTDAVAQAAETDESNGLDGSENTLIVEAGTGTGKTYAYLVPAMLWGGKVIVSTGTKHLQDQLFQRDIPTVRDALAVPVSVAMLKGRANYLCHYYLQRTADNGRLPSRQETSYLQAIVRFAKITRTGDKAELASVPETAAV
jgi:ATP-dependent DNA helicase DinG